ncbi:MAG: PKD domain-containing protein, partial [Bacteroidales bacterium]|nr:PKD domain-containing protein [Bacteroidales bacterium]
MKKLLIFSMLLFIGRFVSGQAISISVSDKVGCVPLIVDFTCNNSNVIFQEWDFGDGTPKSNVMDPSHTYYNAGIYSVKLKVRFQDNSEKDTTFTNLINVSAGPQISFTAKPDSVCPGELVSFTETVSNPGLVKSIVWDFKDGGMSTLSKPTHAYANSG